MNTSIYDSLTTLRGLLSDMDVRHAGRGDTRAGICAVWLRCLICEMEEMQAEERRNG